MKIEKRLSFDEVKEILRKHFKIEGDFYIESKDSKGFSSSESEVLRVMYEKEDI